MTLSKIHKTKKKRLQNKKKVMVQLDQLFKPCGSRWHRPVILPLPGAGGDRCSVRPASRCALPLGATTPRSSLGCLGSTPGLERAGQIRDGLNPTLRAKSTSHHFKAPTQVTSPRYRAQLVSMCED